MVASTFLKFPILNRDAEIEVSQLRSRQRANLCIVVGGYMRGAKEKRMQRRRLVWGHPRPLELSGL